MWWQIYIYVVCVMLVLQMLFVVQTSVNYTYAVRKSARKRRGYFPKTLLTIPCKGLDSTFEKNITSVFGQDYRNFYIHFVVQSENDPAWPKLCELKEKYASSTLASDVKILVAGSATTCGQKVYNLLFSCQNAPHDVEIFAFADSDAHLKPDWLSHLVWPLRKERVGASTGYRWFIPQRDNLASILLSIGNAKVAQLYGNTPFNQAWGGSMAIRKEIFCRIGVDRIWQKALSDDLSLSYAVRKNHLKLRFVPACLVASYEQCDWKGLFEFARRQFLITRVSIPLLWWFGLLATLFSVFGLWGGGGVAVYAIVIHKSPLILFASVSLPVVFFAAQTFRALLRQKTVNRLLPQEAQRFRVAAIVDISGAAFWSWMLLVFILSSAFGRTIRWRNIRYKLHGPTEVVILPSRGELSGSDE